MPAISIIIPAHNEEKYILKTLQSLQQQKYTDYEVIVVANGCTDQTEEILKKHSDGQKIRYLSLPQPNVSVARNAGALNANGQLLLFLDADTQLAADSLQTIQDQFTSHHAVATTESRPDQPLFRYRSLLALKNFYNSTGLYNGCSGALICRKEDFQAIGGYDPAKKVQEHHYLIRQLRNRGKYKCLDTQTITSMRRYEQWGIAKAASFWIKHWVKQKLGKLNGRYDAIR
ncbi:glycosyltransferase [Candidatus Woesearchaeota archaeon]|nr:glycosyltransferase [Candidatus Woesearchaeota archaeon]